MGFEPTISDVTGRRFNQLSYIFLYLQSKNVKNKFNNVKQSIFTCLFNQFRRICASLLLPQQFVHSRKL